MAEALRVKFEPPLPGAEDGPLAGLRFVAKDNFDVAGHRTGCGHPAWLAAAAPAARNAAAVERVLAAGAVLVGKAHLDEFAFSLSGTNVHYGTPTNPAAPEREPGGSSSGSASAVAAGLVDFALGSDTAGSARVPASYCGVLGFRPTYGRVAVDGVAPLAPSFDAVGWFARSGAVLERVGGVLLGVGSGECAVKRILAVAEARQAMEVDGLPSFDAALQQVGERLGAVVEAVELKSGDAGPVPWAAAFRVLQGREAWRCWGEWLRARRPELGPGVAARFQFASELGEEQERQAAAMRERARVQLSGMLGKDTWLAFPTAVGPALPLTMSRAEKDVRRGASLRSSTLAPLIGAPAVSLPLCECAGLPLGLTLMAAPGGDEGLLAAAGALVA